MEAGVTPRTSSAQVDERGLQAASHLRQGRQWQAFFVRVVVSALVLILLPF
jgi:hypothetical protein